MTREQKTVEAMIGLFCRGQHDATSGLCPGCTELRDYTRQRLEKCPFQASKTTCAKCPVHCYKLAMRREIRVVMRYAGPRMLTRYPLMALQHVVDGRRQEPLRPRLTELTQTGLDGSGAECNEKCFIPEGEVLR